MFITNLFIINLQIFSTKCRNTAYRKMKTRIFSKQINNKVVG